MRKIVQQTAEARGALAALMMLAILINVIQFSKIKADLRYSGFPRHETADFTKIVEVGDAGLRVKYALPFELGRKYPGSTVILPRSMNVLSPRTPEMKGNFKSYLLTFGRASHIAFAEYEADSLLTGLSYEGFIVSQGKGGPRSAPFMIVAGPSPNVFLAGWDNGKTVLFDYALFVRLHSKARD